MSIKERYSAVMVFLETLIELKLVPPDENWRECSTLLITFKYTTHDESKKVDLLIRTKAIKHTPVQLLVFFRNNNRKQDREQEKCDEPERSGLQSSYGCERR